MSHGIRRRFLALTAIAALASTSAAQAQPEPPTISLSVAPVSITVPPGSRTAITTVTNPGTSPITVQVRLFDWKTVGQEDVYTPSQALDFSPPLFQLAPGARQVVRVLVPTPAVDQEQAYRLFVDQLPLTTPMGGLQMPIRMILPLFVSPTQKPSHPADQLAWAAKRDPMGSSIELSVTDRGPTHVKISDLSYVVGGQVHVIKRGLSGYALAGQSRTWTIKLPTSPSVLTVVAQLESGPLRVDVPVTP